MPRREEPIGSGPRPADGGLRRSSKHARAVARPSRPPLRSRTSDEERRRYAMPSTAAIRRCRSSSRDKRWSPSLISVMETLSPGRCSIKLHRVAPRHVGVLHPLKNMDGAAGGDRAAEQKMSASILDQGSRNRIGVRRISRRPEVDAVLQDGLPDCGREPVPHQPFREIDRRRDQHETGSMGCGFALQQLPRREEGQPSAHGRADQDERSGREAVDDREGVVEPAREGALFEERRPTRHARNNRSAGRHGRSARPSRRAPRPWWRACRSGSRRARARPAPSPAARGRRCGGSPRPSRH